MKNGKNESLGKFQDLLKTLFQFEASDLDFGIYRVLNYKRDLIEKFINDDLARKVDEAFSKYQEKISERINEEFEQKKQEVIKTLGEDALTTTGDIKEQFKDFPVAKEYRRLKENKDEIRTIDDIKLQVYNDLYEFFSRYYEDGDFVPHYRYSIKSHKYAIPYNGEEVKLYWANYDQYYIKTGELFRDYTFNIPYSKHKCVFRVVKAKEEVGNNKATKERFFVLDDDNPVQIDEKEIVIRFQYRELTEEEIKHYDVAGGSNTAKQEKINAKLYDTIVDRISDIKDNIKDALQSKNNNSAPLLLYQLNRFTRKNTSDYFIHKNLKKFLTEQLDYFIKSEVLSIETLEEEKNIDKHITRAKVVKEIGEDIIDFLAQIEDFQKRLWEKKKFVISTEYVITTDRVPSKFYDGIWSNQEQRKEWEDLGFDIPQTKEELSQRKLPIDTKYFSQAFKEQLLEELTKDASLDDLLDGVLIKSENWQALNLLLNKYKEKVQTIYIDPPFNKEQEADYLYKVNYKDSSWASMLENRLSLAHDLLNERGSIFVRCDYNGNWIVRPLMNEIFGKENFRNEIIVNRFKKPAPKALAVTTESFLFYSKTSNLFFKSVNRPRICTFCKQPIPPRWHPMSSSGEGGPTYIFGKLLYPPKGRHWTYNQDAILHLEKEGRIRINEQLSYVDTRGMKIKGLPEYLETEEQNIDTNWTDITGYKFGSEFQTENSEEVIKRVIESTSNRGDLVVDFFLGSGTTTAVAHKLGRKWIGVEMGEHFYSVVLPRMKRVLAYDKSGISKEVKEYQGGGFFKYYELEQYEETLANCKYEDGDLFTSPSKTPYQEYVFMKDEKMLKALEIDYENNKVKVDLDKLYPNIDIAETLSNLTGKWIKQITEKEVEFEDGSKINIQDLDYKIIKPLIWWE